MVQIVNEVPIEEIERWLAIDVGKEPRREVFDQRNNAEMWRWEFTDGKQGSLHFLPEILLAFMHSQHIAFDYYPTRKALLKAMTSVYDFWHSSDIELALQEWPPLWILALHEARKNARRNRKARLYQHYWVRRKENGREVLRRFLTVRATRTVGD